MAMKLASAMGVGVLGVALTCLAPTPSAWADATTVTEARKLLEAGKVRSAMIALKNRLQAHPKDGEARLLLGRIHLAARDLGGAAKELSLARDLGVARSEWLPLLAEVRIRQGRSDQALSLLETEEGDPEDLKARIAALRGDLLARQGDQEAARAAYQRAEAQIPGFVPALLGRARMALAGEDLEAAGGLLEQIREQDPEAPEAWFLTGALRFETGQPEAAANAYKRAMELDPGDPRPAIGLATTRLALGDAAAARKVVGPWREKAPANPRFRFLEALIALQEGRGEEARSLLESLANRHDLPPAHLHLGRLALLSGQFETAAHHLSDYHRDHPEEVGAAKLLAEAWLRNGAPDKAVAVLEPMREARSESPDFLALLGRAYIAAGRNKAGFRHLEAAVRLAPADERIRTQVAVGYLAGGRAEKAMPELEKVIELDPDGAGARYLLVLQLLRGEDYARAAEVAQDQVQRHPADPVGHNLLGLAYWGLEEREKARGRFRIALERDAGFQEARLNLARMDREAGNPERARQRFQEVLGEQPENRGALLGMVRLEAEQGNREAVGQWLERAWSAHAPDRSIGIELVRHRAAGGDLLPALQVARELRAAYPEDPQVLSVLGQVQQANGNLANAASTFRRLVKLRPESPEAWVALAQVNRARDRRTEALENADRALAIAPEHAPALLLRGQLALAAGDADGALQFAKRLREVRPDAAISAQLVGQAHHKAGDLRAAATAYSRALEQGPTREAAVGLFRIRRQQGRTGAAEEALGRWLESRPDDVDVLALLGHFRQGNGDLHGAIEAYRRAIEAAPEHAGLWNNLAWLYLQTEDERALEHARQAYRLNPESAEIADTYGWAQVRAGNPQKGLRLLQEAAVHAPHIPSIRYHLATALAKTGRQGEARQELKQLLATGEDFQEADEARRLLRSLE
jgi:putative PEP-CTERM system TPR-repeat lipoprotein